VNGPSVALGYWQRPEHTAASFLAHISRQGETAYLRTGDLGYVSNGELYVTGRAKDVVIIYGKKYLPQDLEDEAERSHSSLNPGGGAVFNLQNAEHPHLVLVFELKREWLRRADPGEVAECVRAAVLRAHGVRLDSIVLIKPGELPRTSSGKVRRSQCRDDYLARKLTPL
jgi:acyl-CoA synthetase (AMP-forming)/AMP-acid ligase II